MDLPGTLLASLRLVGGTRGELGIMLQVLLNEHKHLRFVRVLDGKQWPQGVDHSEGGAIQYGDCYSVSFPDLVEFAQPIETSSFRMPRVFTG